mmetsp:Transcript_9940/g.40246  ORF Transcript_9940/g.40246 Transcript_9940/m.40246 type:complete len:383 (-) Transcript_9940:47-1195(-)
MEESVAHVVLQCVAVAVAHARGRPQALPLFLEERPQTRRTLVRGHARDAASAGAARRQLPRPRIHARDHRAAAAKRIGSFAVGAGGRRVFVRRLSNRVDRRIGASGVGEEGHGCPVVCRASARAGGVPVAVVCRVLGGKDLRGGLPLDELLLAFEGVLHGAAHLFRLLLGEVWRRVLRAGCRRILRATWRPALASHREAACVEAVALRLRLHNVVELVACLRELLPELCRYLRRSDRPGANDDNVCVRLRSLCGSLGCRRLAVLGLALAPCGERVLDVLLLLLLLPQLAERIELPLRLLLEHKLRPQHLVAEEDPLAALRQLERVQQGALGEVADLHQTVVELVVVPPPLVLHVLAVAARRGGHSLLLQCEHCVPQQRVGGD